MPVLKAVNLKAPVDHVVLFVRRDPGGSWRFHSWKAAVGHFVPEVPPNTLGIPFSSPEDAAAYFTNVLTVPIEVVPPDPVAVDERMPPAPVCDYYWPPSLESCIKSYERDLQANPAEAMPIRRALILGAGFSAAFQFATSATVVRGMMEFFENYQPSEWYSSQYETLSTWLDEIFPSWRTDSPHLYDFVGRFFPPVEESELSQFSNASVPLVLFGQGISWETENCDSWIRDIRHIPEDSRSILPAFEALMATYLLTGRLTKETSVPWAKEFFQSIGPSDAILTFNWDVIPETLMVEVGTPFCRYDWTGDRAKLIKLHGSVDLLGDPNMAMRGSMHFDGQRFECVTEKLWRARTSESVLARTKPVPFGRVVWPAEHYNKGSVLIMPPRYAFGYGYQLIQFNWRKARTVLERADEIYIVGYSIPKEDLAFRLLVKDVMARRKVRPTIDVWNPDAKVGEHAEELFGKDGLTFHKETASTFQFR